VSEMKKKKYKEIPEEEDNFDDDFDIGDEFDD
jgi:hypothetical protein